MARRSPGKEPSSGPSHVPQILLVVPEVVFFVVALGRQRKANGSGREIIDLAPEHRRQMQAVVRAIEMETLLVFAVVNDDVKAAGHRDEKLMAFLQRMAGAVSSAGNVIQIKDTLDLKRDVPVALEK